MEAYCDITEKVANTEWSECKLYSGKETHSLACISFLTFQHLSLVVDPGLREHFVMYFSNPKK